MKREHGIPKQTVDEIAVDKHGVVGDFNRYRTEKLGGDPNKAVLLLAIETIDALNEERWPVAPGDLGENITTIGLRALTEGARVAINEAELEISEPCIPCSALRVLPYVGRERLKEFIQTLGGRRGWYARVLSPGAIGRGDVITFQR